MTGLYDFRMIKIQGFEESKMVANARNSKTNKNSFFSRMAWYIWLIFCMKHEWDLAFETYQNGEKKHN